MAKPTIARLVVGSFNRKKTAEVLDLLSSLPIEVVSLAGFDGVEAVEETGTTFEANAAIKAAGFSVQIGEPVLADDSGLEVDALGGRPGVYSARYGGEGLTDEERTARLLDELSGTPDAERTARFRCAIAMAVGPEVRIEVSAKVEGRIGHTPAGANGFGYDPVFIPDGSDRTFGQLDPEVKRRTSHRARALAAFRERLADWRQA